MSPRDNNNEDVAIAFKKAVTNPAERKQILRCYPELNNAIEFYEKNKTYFIKNSGLNKHDYIILKALIDNMFFQIKEDGPASFNAITKII